MDIQKIQLAALFGILFSLNIITTICILLGITLLQANKESTTYAPTAVQVKHKQHKGPPRTDQINTKGMSKNMYARLCKKVDTSRPGWEDRLDTFMKTENKKTKKNNPTTATNTFYSEYIDDSITGPCYNDYDDPDLNEMIRDHNEYTIRP